MGKISTSVKLSWERNRSEDGEGVKANRRYVLLNEEGKHLLTTSAPPSVSMMKRFGAHSFAESKVEEVAKPRNTSGHLIDLLGKRERLNRMIEHAPSSSAESMVREHLRDVNFDIRQERARLHRLAENEAVIRPERHKIQNNTMADAFRRAGIVS